MSNDPTNDIDARLLHEVEEKLGAEPHTGSRPRRFGVVEEAERLEDQAMAVRVMRKEAEKAHAEIARLNRVVAALTNDALASGARYEELWDRIQTIAHSPDGAAYTVFKLERLASVTLDLVGALITAESTQLEFAILHCPTCGAQHVDGYDPDTQIDWGKRLHRTHLCHACGGLWKHAEHYSVGIRTEKEA